MSNNLQRMLNATHSILQRLRRALAYDDALLLLTLLGLLTGLFTGLIIVAFRLLIDLPLSAFVPGYADNFEALEPGLRASLIFMGILIISAIIHIAGKANSEVSVSHVLDRLHNYQGRLPAINWLIQFITAVVGIITGQSIGREGPAVHLGAGAGSQLGQWLKLPNNSLNTLIGCGVAAAISAFFNTPMAGVIFAMEVILMEYTITGFVPIILASVTGAALSKALIGADTSLNLVTALNMQSLLELPFMALSGVVIGIAGAYFIRLHIYTLTHFPWRTTYRLLLAATLTSAVAWYIPEVMGLGYDTIRIAIAGQLAFTALLTIAIAKLFTTAVVVGLGVPGGIIGPSLVIGGCIGGAIGILGHDFFPESSSHPSFYIILGMVGMMAAVLNAPLAALVAVLELTYNPNIIFPAMLIIVAACVTTRHFFGLDSIFIEQLKASKRLLRYGPAQQALRRVGVITIMNTNISVVPSQVSISAAKLALSHKPIWLVVDTQASKLLLPAADLANYLDKMTQVEEKHNDVALTDKLIDLEAIPGRRQTLYPIDESDNLLQAWQLLHKDGREALYVSSSRAPLTEAVQGIVTQGDVDNFYRP